jgi:hypothetical protein
MADELDKTFRALKRKLKPYGKKLDVLTDRPNRYELCGGSAYEVVSQRTGRAVRKKNAYFGGIIIRRGYVGLYFMAPYMKKGFMDGFSAGLRRRLKGKSCFHFKQAADVNAEIDKLLKAGFRHYRESGLI